MTDSTALALIGNESHNSDYIRSGLGSNLVDDFGLAIDFTDEEKLVSYENPEYIKLQFNAVRWLLSETLFGKIR